MSAFLRRNESTRIWILEDNVGDQILLNEILIGLNFKAKNLQTFDTLEEFKLAATKDCPDVLLLDLFLPGAQGLETFNIVKNTSIQCPVIVLSGLSDTDTALESVKQGAQDYLIKDEMNEEMIDKLINYAIERYANVIEIKRSEEKYKLLFRSIPVAVIMLDESDHIIEMNDASKSLFNNLESMHGQDITSMIPNNALSKDLMTKLKEGTNRLLKIDFAPGITKYIEFSAAQNKFMSGNRTLLTLLDRTERIESEINRNKIVHETLDEERSRFSRELHDGLAQYLVVLNLQLEMLKGIDSTVDESLVNCLETVNTSIKMVRSISYNLSPPDIEKGLIPALKAFFTRLKNVNNVNFDLFIEPEIEELNLSYLDEYSIFRIVQEFVNNSLKYSECKEVSCSICVKEKKLEISVTDNGKGFNRETINEGLGLKNMNQRAFAAGFNFTLHSELEKGTRITLISEEELDN